MPKQKQSPVVSLTINKKKTNQPLTAAQKTFNRLVRKTEKLRNEIKKQEKELSEMLNYYSKTLHPLELELCEEQTVFLKLLHKLGQAERRLGVNLRKSLKVLQENLLDDIFHVVDSQDQGLKVIYKEVKGESLEDTQKRELDDLKDELSFFAGINGVDIDFDWLRPDMSEEEMLLRMMEEGKKYHAQLEEKAEREKANESSRPKTKKQLERELREQQAEKMRTKSFSEMYKQLAKVLHPDLEPDEKRKEEKELLMKKLTVAYKQKDLHTLLQLELEWIHKEEGELDKLSNEKLKMYNDMLKMQADELEEELHLTRTSPRYEMLHKYVRLSFVEDSLPTMEDLKEESKYLRKRKVFVTSRRKELSGENAAAKFKSYLQKCHLELQRKKEMEQMFEGFDLHW